MVHVRTNRFDPSENAEARRARIFFPNLHVPSPRGVLLRLSLCELFGVKVCPVFGIIARFFAQRHGPTLDPHGELGRHHHANSIARSSHHGQSETHFFTGTWLFLQLIVADAVSLWLRSVRHSTSPLPYSPLADYQTEANFMDELLHDPE